MAKSREHEDSFESGLPCSRAPYDANNSFSSSVKKVATKVTELPQKLFSKWFTAAADGDDKSEITQLDDETDEIGATLQAPPNKRPRIRMDRMHPPGTFKIHPPNDSYNPKFDYNFSKNSKSFTSKSMMDDSLAAVAGPSSSGTRGLVTSTPAVSNPRSQLNLGQNNGTATNGNDDNSESSESTSGCSSLIPQTSRQDEPSANYNSTFSTKRKWTDELLEFNDLVGNQSTSRRTLFLNNSARDSMSSRQPSFNASVMNSTVDKNSSLSSPFYSGNTTYGGASAANLFKRARNNFSTSSELQLKVPKRVTVQVQPYNSTNDSAAMSQTTKRILETLENFTSMVTDAKKMPVKRRSEMYSPARRKPFDGDNSASSRVGLRHMARELVVPTAPDMLKLRRQKLQQTTIGARKIISAISTPAKTTTNKEYQIRNVKDTEPEFQGKLKSNRRGKGTNLEDEETVEAVNLPSIALPISTLPKFDIALPPSQPKSPSKPVVDSIASFDTFKFASPIRVSNVPQKSHSINSYTFSKPLLLNENQEENFAIESSKTMILEKSPKSLSYSTSEPTKSDSGFEEIKSDEKKQSEKKEEPGTVWECPECYIKNSDKGEKCAACRTKKPVTVSERKEEPKQTTLQTGFGAQFKMQTGQWECECCMVRNKQSDAKCVSCSSLKPQPKTLSTTVKAPTQVTTSSDLMSKFKPAEGSWECPGCMIRNPAVTGVCPCCQTMKPGGSNGADKVDKAVKSSTTSEPEMWECSCCMVRSKSSVMVCPCCEAPKPVAKSSLKRGASILESSSSGAEKDTEPEEPKTVEATSSKLKFNCEMPASSTAFKFGINNGDKPATTPAVTNFLSTTNKPEANKSFTFGLPMNAATKEPSAKITTSFSFGTPVQSNIDKLAETPKLSDEKKSEEDEKPKTETVKPKEEEKKTPFSFGSTVATPEVFKDKPETKTVESNFVFGNPTNKQSNPLSGFSFGSSKPSFGLADSSKPTTEVKPLFGNLSSTTSNTSASTAVNTSTTTSVTFKMPEEKPSAVPSLNFGVPASTPSSNALSSLKPATPVVSQPSVALPEPVNAQPTFDSTPKTPSSGFCFGTPASESTVSTPNKNLYFGSIAKTTPTAPSTTASPFGNIMSKNSTEPAKAFGSFFDNASKPAANAFVFTQPSAENKIPVFGSSSTNLAANNTNTTGAFGSANKTSSTPSFGSNTFGGTSASTPNFFSNSTDATKPALGQFAFGAASSQPSSAGFNASTPAPKPVFSFGPSTTSTATATSSATTQQASSGFSGFGAQPAATPVFSFGASQPKPETNSTSMFGQAAPTPIFNATQPANQNNTAFQAPANSGFNFGASNPVAQPAPAFQLIPTPMGQPSAPAAPSSGGFNFSAPPQAAVSFDPNTRPTFNFTGGNAPAAFNAMPVASQSGVRKIKKAVRRVTPR